MKCDSKVGCVTGSAFDVLRKVHTQFTPRDESSVCVSCRSYLVYCVSATREENSPVGCCFKDSSRLQESVHRQSSSPNA